MKQSSYLLSAKNVSKSFSYPKSISILKDINIKLSKKETVAITGPSGSGKSTLMHILGTLEPPTAGTILWFGKQLKRESEISVTRNNRIGFVFQNKNLLEEYTLLENILIKAKIRRESCKKNSEANKRAHQLIERVGLLPRINFPIKYLSGGEKQRAAVARALMNDPDIILADEPTGNLDNTAACEVQSLLMECLKDFQKALIIVTHDMNFANLCNRQYALTDGRLT